MGAHQRVATVGKDRVVGIRYAQGQKTRQVRTAAGEERTIKVPCAGGHVTEPFHPLLGRAVVPTRRQSILHRKLQNGGKGLACNGGQGGSSSSGSCRPQANTPALWPIRVRTSVWADLWSRVDLFNQRWIRHHDFALDGKVRANSSSPETNWA